MPVMAPRRIAASRTVRAMGPAVSWLWEIGTMPDRLISPSVGLIPTSDPAALGEVIDPSVSLPTAAAAKLAATAAPEPELEPEGVRSSAYGFRHCPPRPLQPDDEWVERKFAHSLILVLPSRMAPASRSRAA